MPRQRNPCIRGCNKSLRFWDMFGYQVGFNINGEEVHKTLPGAFVSIFIISWMCVIIYYTNI